MASQPQNQPKGLLRRLAATLPSSIKTPRFGKTLKVGAVALSLAITAMGVSIALNPPTIQASDHDDGDIDTRSRALSLTDLYVFRERDQNPSVATDDLILIMNTNPRSLARVQYYFSSNAQYEFRVSRVGNNNAVPTGVPDVRLRVTFSGPDRANRQRMTLTLVDRNGRETVINRGNNGRPLFTTALNEASTPIINQTRIAGLPVTVFAGLREDPFFFDVEQYFRVRAGLLGTGPSVGFRPPSTARDFAAGYNVNTIALRVPRRLLQGGTRNTTFDVWLSLLTPDPRNGRFVQTEQLARPAVNEVLVINQSTYAQYNRVMPTRNARELAPIAREAKRTLLALGNSDARANALLGAFVPDVMRIDTTGPSGFANALNNAGSPIRGRMLLDDVVDIAFTVLTNGAVTTDNVSYAGEANNPAQGHKQLEASFPYLALPN
ncbi:DUF4331 domain-containing protein [Oscillatoria sp. FACHB-1407]|uniref:DUF4331 domain-containing protein n=1 Tax=Oscillatoria sp. FACHB-1407 TaxID=2692847 RepID=UPI001688BE68|nr:DUF4331 domain-containing protein [Oscillatoria sp. FACHB-1407]MBD2462156.1 DUF4331 domain-containing protein [Oscillatoria sp. FACHB-1407]